MSKKANLFRSEPGNLTKSDFTQFVDHPVLIYHNTWTSSSGVVEFNDLIQTYLSTVSGTPMGNKIANFYYLHAKIKIKVVIQGQPFAAGQIVFAFTPYVGMGPYGATSFGYQTINYTNAKIVPHLVVDPSKSEAYEIDLPVCTPNNYYSLAGNNYNFGSYTMTILPYNPLTSGTAVAATAGICVYMSLVDPKFEGLTFLSSEFETEKSGGLLSNFAKNVGKYAPLLSIAFPEAGPGLTLFSKVSTSAGHLLSWLGYSKPQIVDNTTFVLNRFVDNYSQNDGTSTALVLAASQSTSVGISPSLVGYNPSEMSFAHLCTIKGLVYQGNIPLSSAEGSLNVTIPVDPALGRLVSTNIWEVTPLAGVLQPFFYWSGDITFTFEFVASVFHRCTVLICWDPDPPGSGPPSLPNALQVLQNVTLYISGNTTVDVEIPYKQPIPWLIANGIGDITTSVVAGQNGKIYLFVVNPVTTNGSTDGINFNVYTSSKNIVKAAPDPEFVQFLPSDSKLVTFLSSEFTPVNTVSFGPKTDLSFAELKSFGECYNSIKELTSKVATFYTAQPVIATTFANNGIVTALPNIPRGLWFADQGTNWVAGDNYLTYYAKAFLGYRGGLRWKYHVADTQGISENIILPHYFCSNNPNDLTSFTAAVATSEIGPDYINAYQSAYAFTMGNRGLSPNLDFVAPSLLPLDFYPTRIGTTSYINFIDMTTPLYTPTVHSHQLNVTACSGSSDDGHFVWFLGFPALNANTV